MFTNVFKRTGTLKCLKIANLAILRKYIRKAIVPVLLVERPMTAANGNAPIQRYVSVTSDNKDKGDYVTLNSIAFGMKMAGGEIENFSSSDFSKLSPAEPIAFVGHGGIGYSGRLEEMQLARSSFLRRKECLMVIII